MSDDSQISATVSAATKEKLDRFTERYGLRKNYVVEQALLFLRGRIYFHHVNGKRAAANSGAPSVLIAYGENDARTLEACPLNGQFIHLGVTRRWRMI